VLGELAIPTAVVHDEIAQNVCSIQYQDLNAEGQIGGEKPKKHAEKKEYRTYYSDYDRVAV
jgi:hypothetical protein